MKSTDKKKPVNTIPKGVWEGSRPTQDKGKSNQAVSTDLQNNGYPPAKTTDSAAQAKRLR